MTDTNTTERTEKFGMKGGRRPDSEPQFQRATTTTGSAFPAGHADLAEDARGPCVKHKRVI